MERKDYSKLSNSELKSEKIVLENEFESVKSQIKELCDKLNEIESKYNYVNNEISLRKTIY